MEYNDQDYLKLFKQINETAPTENRDQLRSNSNSYGQMIKETPDYTNYNQNYNQSYKNVNEVQKQAYSQDFNINEFVIETRVNGQSINEVRRQEKEDRLNEVMQQMREKMQEEKELKNINETVKFNDVDYVTLEMFEKARYNSMMKVAKTIDTICR